MNGLWHPAHERPSLAERRKSVEEHTAQRGIGVGDRVVGRRVVRRCDIDSIDREAEVNRQRVGGVAVVE